jgi:hypothetical protein
VPKSSPLSVSERSELVLRLLTKEDSAANLAREAGVSESWSLTVLLDLPVASVCYAASLRRFHDA